jgi:hypothetical protein
MMLSHQEQVQALDLAFGRMATEVGLHAWSLASGSSRRVLLSLYMIIIVLYNMSHDGAYAPPVAVSAT